MASESQIAANILNARSSTGPCTQSGKDQSKLNSTTHGLSGSGEALDRNDESDAEQRYRVICTSRAPANALECFVIRRMSTESMLLDKCEKRIDTLYDNASFRAAHDWDGVRESTVRKLVPLLAEDPASAIDQLLQSPQGCTALIDQWDGLDGYLNKDGCWSPQHRNRAFDLMGVDPLLRDSGETELDPRPGDGTTALSRAKAVVQRERLRLRERADSPWINRADEREQEQAVSELTVLDTRQVRLSERYRAEHARRVQWWWNTLNQLQGPNGRERAADGAAQAKATSPQARAEAIRRLKEACVRQEKEKAKEKEAKLPQWAQPTEKQMAEAEQLFQQHQAEAPETKAAEETPKTPGSDGTSPSPVASSAPEAVSPTPAPVAPETPVPPMTRKERREHKQRLREEERRRQISIKAAGNGALRH